MQIKIMTITNGTYPLLPSTPVHSSTVNCGNAAKPMNLKFSDVHCVFTYCFAKIQVPTNMTGRCKIFDCFASQ